MERERERAKSASIAKWGAACAPCATAKAKCLRSNDSPGSKCDRCERLQKDCAGQVHRPRKKRQTRPSKTAQLEERLNSLVDLLRASNSGQAVSSSASDGTFHYGTPFEAGPRSIRRPSGPASSQSSPATATSGYEASSVVPLQYNDHAPPKCICRAPVAPSFEPVEPDEVLLSTFMTKLSPNYPFVTLRPGTSLAELRATKPFLLSVIRMVASIRHTASMRAQYYVIIKHISEQALLRSERSLELLQGILLILGWYHHHCMLHTQMNNLASLAVSLSWDLGLCNPPGLLEKTRLLVLNPEQPSERTNEERRAMCGTWYINSAVAMSYGKADRPKYSRYIAQCVRELQSAKEFESDLVLVQLMKIQSLTDRIYQLLDSDNDEEEVASVARAPTMAYVSAFQADLDRFKAQIPRHLKSNRVINFHVRSATMRLWEPPKLDAALLENLSKSFTSLSTGGPSTLDFLYNSHNALKEWFEFLLSIEPGEFAHLSMPPCAQLIIAVMFLARWTRLSCTNIPRTYTNTERIFDPTSVNGGGTRLVADLTLRDTDPAVPAAAKMLGSLIHSQPGLHLDVAGLLHRLIQLFHEVRAVIGGNEGPDLDYNIWDMAAHKMGILRLKLERWTEIVATLGSEGLLARKSQAAGDSEGSSSAEESSDVAEATAAAPPPPRAGPMEGIEIVDAATMPPNPEAWQYNNNVFANDLFDGLGLDQNFFYDGGDYGASLLNSLQPIMQ